MVRYGLKARIAVVALLLSILSGCSALPVSPSRSDASPAAPSLTASASTPAPSPSGALQGIDPEKFTSVVNASIKELNDSNKGAGDFKIAQISVTGIIGVVDITLTDTSAWSVFTAAEKKEYMTGLGKALDALAIDNAYPGTLRKVGTDTTLFGPDGAELAERSSLGIVFLY